MIYTALIRTNNSFPLVVDVVTALRAQSLPPQKIIAVDSASNLHQRETLNKIFDVVIDYPNEPFNYSKAINIGIEACDTEYVLIISSHVVINDSKIIESGLKTIASGEDTCLGCCFNPNPQPALHWADQLVDKTNFSPTLGFSNSCALLKVQKILDRPFREDVFSCEDQEWAAFYLRQHASSFFSITSHEVKYLNKHANDLKIINEEIAMAYFIHPKLMRPVEILKRFLRAFIALMRNRPARARFHYAVASELLLAHFRKPVRKSSYY